LKENLTKPCGIPVKEYVDREESRGCRDQSALRVYSDPVGNKASLVLRDPGESLVHHYPFPSVGLENTSLQTENS